MCKRWQAFLLAGLAVAVCGMTTLPAMAQTASITFLDEFDNPSYFNYWITGMSISDDASVLVGAIPMRASDGHDIYYAFRWTADTGLVFLTPPPGYGPRGTVDDISADGTKMLMSFSSSTGSGNGTFYWTADEGYVDISNDLPGGALYSGAGAMSEDGSTVVGWSQYPPYTVPYTFEAYSMILGGTSFRLGDLAGGSFQSRAFDVSGDGRVVVGDGTANWYGFDFKRATRWTMGSSGDSYNVEVPDFASAGVYDLDSRAWAVSDDGTVTVGEVTTPVGRAAFRWTADGGVDLPFRSAGVVVGSAKIISSDGSLIVSSVYGRGSVIWDAATSRLIYISDIQDMLVNDFGITMPPGRYLGSILAIKSTPQGIMLMGAAGLIDNPDGRPGIPYIAHLPYLPIGSVPEPKCSATWESSAVGNPGLSAQAPWEGVDVNAFENVVDLVVFDDGNGPALYASGLFQYAGGTYIGNGIAKWDGQTWSPLGIGLFGPGTPSVDSLTVFDDGTGPALYVNGSFTVAGGVLAANVAKWDGQQWSAIGWAPTTDHFTMQTLDDGSGPELYAHLPIVGNGTIVKWDGSQWLSVGTSGLENCQSGALEFFDDGTGPVLYGIFGGTGCFGSADPNYERNQIAKLDGTQWVSVAVLDGPGSNTDLISWDDGSGPALYVLGWNILSVNGDSDISGIVRWDGSNWSTTRPTSDTEYGYARGAIVNDGNGPALVVSGYVSLIKWDGQSWSNLAPFGYDTAPQGPVSAIVEYDDGQGSGIYLGGDFFSAGPDFARNIAMLRACTISHPGDCDADSDVDMTDLDFFSSCLNGPDGGLSAGCECADVDGDGDVDLSDFQSVMASFTG